MGWPVDVGVTHRTAFDCQYIRNTANVVYLVNRETEAPQAMIRVLQKESAGENSERKADQRMIREETDLSDARVTVDTLHCQHQTTGATRCFWSG